MDLKEIQNLIKFVAKSGATEVKLEMGDIKITIKTGGELEGVPMQTIQASSPAEVQQIMQAPLVAQAPAAAAAAPVEDENLHTITSPMIGTFYRKPAPDKASFVEVGAVISENSIVCVIEAMKLFNEIESEVNGKIVKILVDDNSPVEFGQPLFLVDPSA